MLAPGPGSAQEKPNVSNLEAVASLSQRQDELEIQRYVLISPLPWLNTEGPGMRHLGIDINPLGFQSLAAVAGASGNELWLVMAAVPSAMKVPDVKLFLLDAFKLSSPEKGVTQSRSNPCNIELQDIHICLSSINRPSEAPRCDGN